MFKVKDSFYKLVVINIIIYTLQVLITQVNLSNQNYENNIDHRI